MNSRTKGSLFLFLLTFTLLCPDAIEGSAKFVMKVIICCSQNAFLHGGLIEKLNVKLFLGIISETVHIADSIRAAKPERDVDSLESWDMSLKGFEVFGMSVGFLRVRIRILMDLSHEPRAMIESRRKERAALGDEARKIESRLLDVRKSMEQLDTEIETLLVLNKQMAFMFEQVARLPWARA